MPDVLTSNPLGQESAVTEVAQVTPQPAAVVAPERPVSAREQIYNQYYSTPVAEPVAAPVETPIVETPPASDQPVQSMPSQAELMQAIAGLQAQVQQLTQSTRPPEAPAATAPAQTKLDWIEAIRSGDFEKAKELVRQDVEDGIGPRLQQQAVQQALTMYRVENDMGNFITTIRANNSDLAPLEHYISSVVGARIQEAQSSGGIKDPTQYAETFKRVLTEEVGKARNLFQQLRAAGKTDAMTVRTEVLSASTVAANPSEQLRGAVAKPEAPPVQTVSDYITQRRALANAGKLLSN